MNHASGGLARRWQDRLIQVKSGPRGLDRLHPQSGHSMFRAKQSFAGTRRRTAMWLIAAWLVFGVSQAFAACCMPAAVPIHTSTQAVAVPQHQDETGSDDCCDTLDQSCQMALEAAPPGAPGLFVPGQIKNQVGPAVQLALHLPAAALADGPARVPIPRAPPDPIYLRLQRLLI